MFVEMNKFNYVFLLIVFLAFVGCSKEGELEKLNIHPSTDRLTTVLIDTIEIEAYSVADKSILATNLSKNLLGEINDSVFGNLQASFYTQFKLERALVNFGENPQADSAVITLVYGGYYGDTLAPIEVAIYELDEDMSADSAYHSNRTFAVKPENLVQQGKAQVAFAPKTTNEEERVAMLRIPVSTAWIQSKFLSKSGMDELADNTNFIEYFKGLYVVASKKTAGINSGCLAYFNLTDAESQLTIYYSNADTTNQQFHLLINESAVHVSHFVHDFSQGATDLIQQLNGNTTLGKETVYAQAASGVSTTIFFPNIQRYFNGKDVVVQKAELTCYVKNTDKVVANATTMTLNRYLSDGNVGYLPDDAIFQGSSYFGGNYANSTYTFRLNNYIQGLIKGEQDYGIKLTVSGNAIKADDLVFYGTNPADQTKRMKLAVTYTIIN